VRGLADGKFTTIVHLFPFTDLAPGLTPSPPGEQLPARLHSVDGGSPAGSLTGIRIFALISINQYSRGKVAAWGSQHSKSPRARKSLAAPGEVCTTHSGYLGHGHVGSAVRGMSLCEVFPNLGAQS